MKITVDTRELDALRRNIAGFSERRMRAVVATALTRTVKRAQGSWGQQLAGEIDRPTARTVGAAGMRGARADNLEAEVFLKDQAVGVAPAQYLKPQLFGGSRVLKKFEQALISSGAMPRGYLAVPGRGAQRDGYGNVSRAQLVAVIRSLGQDYSPGYQQVISKSTARRLQSQAKHGRKYIAFLPANAKRVGVSPGIYERMPDRRLVAVFLYKNQVTYKRLLRLVDREAIAAIEQDLKQETDRALAESLQRLQARGSQ
jgi:hypothetical protein